MMSHLLKEARRRYCLFHVNEPLTEAWTGLGDHTTYEPVLKAGLMEWVHGRPPKGDVGWLRLTETGAEIIQSWLDESSNRLSLTRR